MEEKILEFPSTAGFGEYKQFFSKASISHPAKANLLLLKWILENYTCEGETVLDVMAGTGSTVVMASLLNRNGVGVELEPHFYKMMVENKAKTEAAPTLTPKGSMRMFQGDSRELSKILGETDVIITSPPYSNRLSDSAVNDDDKQRMSYRQTVNNLEKVDAVITSPPYADLSVKANKKLVERMGVDYENGNPRSNQRFTTKNIIGKYEDYNRENRENIGNLKGGDVDAVIDAIVTSPPYERIRNTVSQEEAQKKKQIVNELRRKRGDVRGGKGESGKLGVSQISDVMYSKAKENIGNLKGGNVDSIILEKEQTKTNYWSEMAKIYGEAWKVLKPQGKMVLVVKNFIRQKKIVDLAGDTIKLVESLNFTLVDRLRFKLPTKSFWRILEIKKWEKEGRKYPEDMFYEHILIFRKVR